jgi:hypothetical protein
MNEAQVRELLRAVRAGTLSDDDAVERLVRLPFARVGDAAHFDTHRALRTGVAEVIYAPGKTDEDLEALARLSLERHAALLVSRVEPERAARLCARIDGLVHHPRARMLSRRDGAAPAGGPVAVVSAGTADVPVAEEAAVTAEHLGATVDRLYDVGVAGVHRLLHHLDRLRAARALVAVAGMEGALPSVLAGLVGRPIVAVPTSVGYGASFGGLAALLTMLNTCAVGVSVVNIDNGFGAGCVAHMIARPSGPAPDAGGRQDGR